MKRPKSDRWLDRKEFSYLMSWGCIVLACAMLFPIVLTSTTAATSGKVTVCVILAIFFLLGVYSLVVDFIDYLKSKKTDEKDDGGLQ